MYLTSDIRPNQAENLFKLGDYQTWPEGLKVREDNMFKVNRQTDGNQVTPEDRAVDVCSFLLTSLFFFSGVTC